MSASPKRKRGDRAAIHGHAVKAVVQILFATSRPYTIDTLREKLREFFLEEADHEQRAVASLSEIHTIRLRRVTENNTTLVTWEVRSNTGFVFFDPRLSTLLMPLPTSIRQTHGTGSGCHAALRKLPDGTEHR